VFYLWLLLLLFFLDNSLPLSRLLIPNPHGMFEFEGRNIIFECEGMGCERSFIFKRGISKEILEVFTFLELLCYFVCYIVR
jgi:hypothetical protein